MSTKTFGIDVYDGDGDINWSAVKGDKVRFAFIKVNEGTLIDARATAGRVKDAESHGILVGGYDFLYPRPGRKGSEEFDIFYAHAKKIGLVKPGKSLRCVADVEVDGAYDSSTLRGRIAIRAYVRSWVKRCHKVTGKYPIIYTGHYWRENLRNPRRRLAYGCPLWLAAYVPYVQIDQYVPAAWKVKGKHVSFWQYSETSRVAGVPGACDANYYFGTLASLNDHQTI